MSEMYSTPKSKVCKKCGIDKPLDDFHKSPTCKLGRRATCKECRKPKIKEYSDSHKEEIRQKSREYYWANREKCIKTTTECHKKNKEATAERKKRWSNEAFTASRLTFKNPLSQGNWQSDDEKQGVK